MSPTFHRRDDCDGSSSCPPTFRSANYAIIIVGVFVVISLASCFVLRNRRRRHSTQPRPQHYSNGPAHIAEFIRLPPPPTGYVPHAPYQQPRPPVFEPAPPYDHTKGPQLPPNPPPPLLTPQPSHAASAQDPPPQAAAAAELDQPPTAPPMDYPPPSYFRA